MKKARIVIVLLLGIILVVTIPLSITNIKASSETNTWAFCSSGFFPKHLSDSYYGSVQLGYLADVPSEVQGVYWYDCTTSEWKFWAPGAPGCTLTTLGGGHTYDYMVAVTGACEWEVPLSIVIPTPTPTLSPTEAVILGLIDEQIAALNELDWETVYNQRSPSYRLRVTLQEFAAFFEVAYADVIPLIESGQAEVVFTDLEISVEGEYAYITGEVRLNGTVLLPFTDESPDIWQKIDSTWYNLETNPSFPGYDPSELPS